MTEQHAVPTSAVSPLISVVIASRNRVEMLSDSIHSVLCQTYNNLEVVIVDDGSEDDTRGVVERIEDPRVRYVRQEQAGISAARNRGTEHARGEWIAVHDDDDIMLPSRLSEQMEHADDDVDFVYGAFINFDDISGELQLHHGRNYGYGPALMGGFAPGHSTWLVRTNVMRAFPYDEGIESAVDNNVAFRMLRSGVRFRHSGAICLLRRVHSGRITDTGGAGQKYVAGLNLTFISRGVPEASKVKLMQGSRLDWGPVDKIHWETRYLAYLPDHLVKRTGYLTLSSSATEMTADGARVPTTSLTAAQVGSMSWRDFLSMCSRGAEHDQVRARLREREEIEQFIASNDLAFEVDEPDLHRAAIQLLFRTAQGDADATYFAVASASTSQWTGDQTGLTAALCVAGGGEAEMTYGLVRLRSLAAAAALQRAAFAEPFTFRVFSTAPYTQIAAELAASS